MKKILTMLCVGFALGLGAAVAAPGGSVPAATAVNGEWDFYDGIKVCTISPPTGCSQVQITSGTLLSGGDGGFNNVVVGSNLSDGGITGRLTDYGALEVADAGMNNISAASLSLSGTNLFQYNNAAELAVGDGTFHNLLDCTVSNTTCTIAGSTNARDAGFNCITASDAGFQNVTVNGLTASTIGAFQGADAGFNSIFATGTIYGNDAGFSGQVTINGQIALVQHGATQRAIECGSDAGVAGSATFPFATAFAAAPVCVCSHVDTTNTNPCTVDHTTVPTTALAKFNVVSGGTDVISYCCYGAR